MPTFTATATSPAATNSTATHSTETNPTALDPSTDKRFKRLNVTMKRVQFKPDALIEVLHAAQGIFGFLEPEVLYFVARELQLPLSRVYGVATFYQLFSLKPTGKHTCVVCMGTACYVKGGDKVLAALEEQTGVSAGETTPDGQISLASARCIGACGIAPAVVFDGQVAPQQTPESVIERIKPWQVPE